MSRMDGQNSERDLVAIFEALGVDDPEAWARPDVQEDHPQLARFLLLRTLWREIDGWHHEIDRHRAGRRLLEQGADRDDLIKVARAAAYGATFNLLYLLDEGYDADTRLDGVELPGWCLQETDSDGDHTGRRVDALHEELESMDPSGREAQDLWQ